MKIYAVASALALLSCAPAATAQDWYDPQVILHHLYVEGEGDFEKWTALTAEQFHVPIPEEARRTGHGGSDWFVARTFLDVLLERRPNPVDPRNCGRRTV